MSRTYAQQKAGLTRARNAGDYDKMVAECTRTIAEWSALPHGWPDDWHRWNIALEDAWQDARAAYVRGQRDTLPDHLTLEGLRTRVELAELAELRARLAEQDAARPRPRDLAELADRIDPDLARLALARIMQTLGAAADWDSDTMSNVAAAVAHAHPVGLPSPFDQDDDALTFWQSVAL
jgi:hypothetical protein